MLSTVTRQQIGGVEMCCAQTMRAEEEARRATEAARREAETRMADALQAQRKEQDEARHAGDEAKLARDEAKLARDKAAELQVVVNGMNEQIAEAHAVAKEREEVALRAQKAAEESKKAAEAEASKCSGEAAIARLHNDLAQDQAAKAAKERELAVVAERKALERANTAIAERDQMQQRCSRAEADSRKAQAAEDKLKVVERTLQEAMARAVDAEAQRRVEDAEATRRAEAERAKLVAVEAKLSEARADAERNATALKELRSAMARAVDDEAQRRVEDAETIRQLMQRAANVEAGAQMAYAKKGWYKQKIQEMDSNAVDDMVRMAGKLTQARQQLTEQMAQTRRLQMQLEAAERRAAADRQQLMAANHSPTLAHNALRVGRVERDHGKAGTSTSTSTSSGGVGVTSAGDGDVGWLAGDVCTGGAAASHAVGSSESSIPQSDCGLTRNIHCISSDPVKQCAMGGGDSSSSSMKAPKQLRHFTHVSRPQRVLLRDNASNASESDGAALATDVVTGNGGLEQDDRDHRRSHPATPESARRPSKRQDKRLTPVKEGEEEKCVCNTPRCSSAAVTSSSMDLKTPSLSSGPKSMPHWRRTPAEP